ncbi:PAS domain-containing protein [Actinoplanes sp. CA-252034]|uniref:PAS domain-containing protein n=1 Tax=Actinoplanes sp. CA-252034 TaxID=3239906 RepID=UPI003D97212C
MDLDDILEMAATHRPSPLELARARRLARTVQSAYDRALDGGYEILVDTDPVDPLTAEADEVTRIARAAQLAKRGTITWTGDAGLPVCSDEMAMILGCAPAMLHNTTVEVLTELVHPADRATVRSAVETAWRRRRPGEITFRVVDPGAPSVTCAATSRSSPPPGARPAWPPPARTSPRESSPTGNGTGSPPATRCCAPTRPPRTS